MKLIIEDSNGKKIQLTSDIIPRIGEKISGETIKEIEYFTDVEQTQFTTVYITLW